MPNHISCITYVHSALMFLMNIPVVILVTTDLCGGDSTHAEFSGRICQLCLALSIWEPAGGTSEMVCCQHRRHYLDAQDLLYAWG